EQCPQPFLHVFQVHVWETHGPGRVEVELDKLAQPGKSCPRSWWDALLPVSCLECFERVGPCGNKLR
ncbi:unnamed protein product, partial [Gulo gulo]